MTLIFHRILVRVRADTKLNVECLIYHNPLIRGLWWIKIFRFFQNVWRPIIDQDRPELRMHNWTYFLALLPLWLKLMNYHLIVWVCICYDLWLVHVCMYACNFPATYSWTNLWDIGKAKMKRKDKELNRCINVEIHTWTCQEPYNEIKKKY